MPKLTVQTIKPVQIIKPAQIKTYSTILNKALSPLSKAFEGKPGITKYLGELTLLESTLLNDPKTKIETIITEFNHLRAKYKKDFKEVMVNSGIDEVNLNAQLASLFPGYLVDLSLFPAGAIWGLVSGTPNVPVSPVSTAPYDFPITSSKKIITATGSGGDVTTGNFRSFTNIYHVEGSASTEAGVAKNFQLGSLVGDKQIKINLCHSDELFAWRNETLGWGAVSSLISIMITVSGKISPNGPADITYRSYTVKSLAALCLEGEVSTSENDILEVTRSFPGNVFYDPEITVRVFGEARCYANTEKHCGAGAATAVTVNSIELTE
jgi:hypothetical protein